MPEPKESSKEAKQFNRNIKGIEPFKISPLAEKITKIGIHAVARIAMTVAYIRRGCKKI